jgi:hypothetical protein
MSSTDLIKPICPKHFKDEVHSDVSAFDRPGLQTQNDSTTGEPIIPGEGNELIGGVVGVTWNDDYATTTRVSDKGKSSEELTLQHFAQLVSLCPEGATLTFQTDSKWLVEEWDKMVQWRENGYERLDRADCMEPWHRIMTNVERGRRRAQGGSDDVRSGGGQPLWGCSEATGRRVYAAGSALELMAKAEGSRART